MSNLLRMQREWLKAEPQVLDLPAALAGEFFPSSAGEPAVVEYWNVLWRRRWTVLAMTAGLLLVTAGVSFTMAPRYKTDARISVGKEGADILGFKDGGAIAPVDETEYNMQLDAQVKILSSDTVVSQTLKELHVIGSPATASELETPENATPPLSNQEVGLLRDYENRLQVVRVPHTPIIEIQFTSFNRQITADFVNSLIQVYIEQNFKTRYESTRQVSGWLSKQLEDLKKKIEDSQTTLANFQKENGILGVDDKKNIITQKLDDLNRELTSAQADRMQKEAYYRATEGENPELVPGVDNSAISKLKDQQANVANSYAQATATMGPAHPKVIELRSQLDQINSALRGEFKKTAERNKNSFLISQHREQMLSGALEQQKKAANELNSKAIQYQILKHEAESNQQLYDGLSQKLKEAGLSAGLHSGNVRVLDYARVPFSPSSPNIPLNLALALVAGCIGGSTLAFVLERLDRTLRSPRQIESLTSLPLVAVVPMLPETDIGKKKKDNEREVTAIVTQPESRMQLLESYRALRTSLLMQVDGPPKVIMVTSSLPFEGKTTTSINCAMVLAQRGTRVLLVDADLRAPRIHRVLALHPGCGLSTLLDEKPDVTDRDAIVQYSRVPNLYVLPAGPLYRDPSRLLDSGIMKKKITKWREVFSHIVIDTPPVLSSSDSLILSSEADSVLLTILANHTPKSAILRARDMLMSVNAKLAGVVVNGVDIHSSEYSAYGYSEYGDRTNPSKTE